MRDRLNYRTAGDPIAPCALAGAWLLIQQRTMASLTWICLAEHFFVWCWRSCGGMATHHCLQTIPPSPVPRYVAEFEHIRSALNLGCWGLVGQSYAAGLAINYALSRTHNASQVWSSRIHAPLSATSPPPERKKRNVHQHSGLIPHGEAAQ